MAQDPFNQLPPELREVIEKLKPLLSKWKLIVFGILTLLIVMNGFFTVKTEEVGIITRFGKFSREVESGLKFKMPFIEKVS